MSEKGDGKKKRPRKRRDDRCEKNGRFDSSGGEQREDAQRGKLGGREERRAPEGEGAPTWERQKRGTRSPTPPPPPLPLPASTRSSQLLVPLIPVLQLGPKTLPVRPRAPVRVERKGRVAGSVRVRARWVRPREGVLPWAEDTLPQPPRQLPAPPGHLWVRRSFPGGPVGNDSTTSRSPLHPHHPLPTDPRPRPHSSRVAARLYTSPPPRSARRAGY